MRKVGSSWYAAGQRRRATVELREAAARVVGSELCRGLRWHAIERSRQDLLDRERLWSKLRRVPVLIERLAYEAMRRRGILSFDAFVTSG